MGLIMFIIIGAVIGLLIGAAIPHTPGGLAMVIGLLGGLIGGIAGAALGGMNPLTQVFGLWAWVGAIVGAILVMAVYALIAAPGTPPRQEARPASGDRTTGRH